MKKEVQAGTIVRAVGKGENGYFIIATVEPGHDDQGDFANIGGARLQNYDGKMRANTAIYRNIGGTLDPNIVVEILGKINLRTFTTLLTRAERAYSGKKPEPEMLRMVRQSFRKPPVIADFPNVKK